MAADDVRAKLDVGRDCTGRDLRALADRIERLSIEDAAEVLIWLAPHLDRRKREADFIFGAILAEPRS